MPNGWIFVLLVMGERMIISICVGEMDLFLFFLNKVNPLKDW